MSVAVVEGVVRLRSKGDNEKERKGPGRILWRQQGFLFLYFAIVSFVFRRPCCSLFWGHDKTIIRYSELFMTIPVVKADECMHVLLLYARKGPCMMR